MKEEISVLKKEQVLIQKELKRHKDLLSGHQPSSDRSSAKFKQLEENFEHRLEQKLGQLRNELETKFENRIKHLTQTCNSQEKQIDKMGSSILKAVDQKFSKDNELKQRVFYKLDERMDKFEADFIRKNNELTNLVNSKVLNAKTELEENCQEIKKSCKTMIQEIDTSKIRKYRLQFPQIFHTNL